MKVGPSHTIARRRHPLRPDVDALAAGRRIALAIGVLVALPACGQGNDCHLSTLNARLLGGTVATAVAGDPPHPGTFTSGGPEWSLEDGCALRSATTVLIPNGPAGGTTLALRCTIHLAYYRLALTLPDLRSSRVGSGFGELRLDAEAYASPTCNSTDHASGGFTYEVIAAQGDAAPSPDFVTPDYQREFSIHFAAEFSTACGAGSISADATLTQTSADVVPNSGCMSE